MSRTRSAALIATGDELVLGSTVDTNSCWLAGRLVDLGWTPGPIIVLGDDEQGLAATLVELARTRAVIVITGGLGPTLDDVTRHAAARAARCELALDERALAELRAYFATRGRPFARSNERQAWFPKLAEILPNPVGTAPGFALAIGGARVFALPGPPREMRAMFAAAVVPRLDAIAPAADATEVATYYLFGLSESVFADQCGAWMARDANPLLGVTASLGVLSVRLRARAGDAVRARAIVAARAEEFRARFGAWIFSADEPEPAAVLGRELIARRLSIAVAESCTGGLLAEKLTRVAGISAVFGYGFVTYANAAKTRLLDVPSELLAEHGAVSREVAEAMARGAAEKSGARIALAITGIAGPEGGTLAKPVGLVWLAVACDGRVASEERRFAVSDRNLVRELAVNTACDLARRRLRGLRTD